MYFGGYEEGYPPGYECAYSVTSTSGSARTKSAPAAAPHYAELELRLATHTEAVTEEPFPVHLFPLSF